MTYIPKPTIGKKVVTTTNTAENIGVIQPSILDNYVYIPIITREQHQKTVENLQREGKLRLYRPEV